MAFSISEFSSPKNKEAVQHLIYGNQTLKYLHKKYLTVISPKKHQEKQLLQKEYEIKRNQDEVRKSYKRGIDQVRDQTEERIEMHSMVDQIRDKTKKRKAREQTVERKDMHSKVNQVRDQTEERKDMHAQVDQVRDQTEERKDMHAKVDQVRDQTEGRKEMHTQVDQIRDKKEKRKARDQTAEMHAKSDKKRDCTENRKAREQREERKYYRKARDNLRYQKKIYETFDNDTGFDVICSSCLQYKNMQYCKPVSILSKEKQKTFIVKYCSILKNRSKDQVVCNICLKDIKQNKVPKRSHRSAFKFANFPRYLIQNLKS